MEKSLCKHKCGCTVEGNQLFCSRCFHNFNPKDSFYRFDGGYLCPLCHPAYKETIENGDLLRHLEQLWDEVQILKREVRELKRKSDGTGI